MPLAQNSKGHFSWAVCRSAPRAFSRSFARTTAAPFRAARYCVPPTRAPTSVRHPRPTPTQDRRYFKQQEIVLWRKLQAQTANMRAIDATKKL